MTVRRILAAAIAGALSLAGVALAAPAPIEPPYLSYKVAAGQLPPVAERLPGEPAIVRFDGKVKRIGRHGGDLRLIMAKGKDIRMMMVYGYARLVGYDEQLRFKPDLLRALDIVENRIFTFHLRKGHKWSDGHPFTSEDFRYYWEDVANDKDLSPFGPTRLLKVDGELPTVTIIDPLTIRYSWSKPNPYFVPALAGARPLFIYRPAHYLKQFHGRYTERKALKRKYRAAGSRNWAALHHRRDHQYKYDNPELPMLQPWINTTSPPSYRFVFVRNPYYHRVDSEGRQLPYIDRVIMTISNNKLVAAKTGAGDADLQGRYLRLNNYTFLKMSERRIGQKVRLWRTGKGAQKALYPNLNVADPVWRKLLRDVRFRRALSLAIHRHEINQVIYYGLVLEGNNTVLPKSPLFRPEYQKAWADFDLKRANRLLDEVGLTKRDSNGLRLLPDGRPLEIIVETSGESTEETDILELVHDSWLRAGIKLFTKPSQREVFRNRIFSGETVMSIWAGLINALPTPEMSPAELAPTSQHELQWPKWGQYYETGGKVGEPIDMPAAKRLFELNEIWRNAKDTATRERVWHEMLKIHAEQQFTIGIIAGVLQPVVINDHLMNVPVEGTYNWDPGAYFGMYRPDTFWFTKPRRRPTQ